MDLTRYDKLRSAIRRTLSPDEAAAADRALEYAAEHTASQVRHDGSPMLDHAAEVARIGLEEIGLGGDSVVAAILHDVVRTASRQDEETFLRLTDEIRDRFGKEVLGMTVSLSHISDIRLKASREQAENFRELIVSYSEDPRVILIKLADRLHKTREKAAAGFEKHILSTLARLGMPETVFRIALTPLAEPGRTGRDSVQFLFTANPRMTPQPVERIASGGELSRVMLALKALLAERMQLPTIIFDEIDTGVSGRIADAMGEIIASLSASMQVVDITHLPQVASKGTAHFVVYKRGGRTDITRLGDEERVTEIAKMLSGSEITDAAVAQARILLGK